MLALRGNVHRPPHTQCWLRQSHPCARRYGTTPEIVGQEAPQAWLVNTAEMARLFGYPRVPLARMLDWVADWVARDMPNLGKPTGFEVRDGKF